MTSRADKSPERMRCANSVAVKKQISDTFADMTYPRLTRPKFRLRVTADPRGVWPWVNQFDG